jgi:hypothetical protein
LAAAYGIAVVITMVVDHGQKRELGDATIRPLTPSKL